MIENFHTFNCKRSSTMLLGGNSDPKSHFRSQIHISSNRFCFIRRILLDSTVHTSSNSSPHHLPNSPNPTRILFNPNHTHPPGPPTIQQGPIQQCVFSFLYTPKHHLFNLYYFISMFSKHLIF